MSAEIGNCTFYLDLNDRFIVNSKITDILEDEKSYKFVDLLDQIQDECNTYMIIDDEVLTEKDEIKFRDCVKKISKKLQNFVKK